MSVQIEDMEERNVELDPELWNRIPTELLEKVLAKLPLTSLLSFRVLSQEWKSYFYSGCSEWPPSLFFPDSGSKSWKREVLPDFHLRKTCLVAADGGLFCFTRYYTPDTFIIYNPLSKQWRKVKLPSSVLPRLPRGSVFEDACTYILVGLAVNRETGVYNLLVAGLHQDCPRDALMYVSSTRDWKRCASVPPFTTCLIRGKWVVEWVDGEDWCSERSLCCGGNLYWLVYESNYTYHNVKALLKYCVEKDEWTIAQEPAPSDYSEFHIVSHDQNILLLDWFDRTRFRIYCNKPVSELQYVGSEIKQLSGAEIVEKNMVLLYSPLRK